MGEDQKIANSKEVALFGKIYSYLDNYGIALLDIAEKKLDGKLTDNETKDATKALIFETTKKLYGEISPRD